MPISALLARIRNLVPTSSDRHYDEIVRSFGIGALRPPPTPMSDRELARAIAEFLKDAPPPSRSQRSAGGWIPRRRSDE